MEVALTKLSQGNKAKLVRFTGGEQFQSKVRALGFREGKTIRVVATQPLRGPLVIALDGRHFTIGRGMCARIFVEVGE